jgi:hypothetical protein
MRQRGSRLIPGVLPESVTGIPVEDAMAMPAEEFCARVLARICEAALEHADDRALFLDYALLPDAVPDVLAPWFGIDDTPADRERMLDRAGNDAKTPSAPFAPALEGGVASEPAIRAAAVHLGPTYERLRAAAERVAA